MKFNKFGICTIVAALLGLGLTGCISSGERTRDYQEHKVGAIIERTPLSTQITLSAAPPATTSPIPITEIQNREYISYEEIHSQVMAVVGGERPVSKDKLTRLREYLDTLVGRHVEWEGWIGMVSPDRLILEDIEKTEKYTGNFRIYVDMKDPERPDSLFTDGLVLLGEVRRAQAEQFAQWRYPGSSTAPQKIRFKGEIIGTLEDPIMVFVVPSEITPKN